MLPRPHFRLATGVLLAGVALLAGCSTPSTKSIPASTSASASAPAVHNGSPGRTSSNEVSDERNTGIDPKDLAATTTKMAQSIGGMGDLATTASTAYIVVVVESIRNETPLPIDEELLTERVRSGLNHSAGGRLQFVTHEHMLAIEHDRQSRPVDNTDPILGAPHGVDYQLIGSIGRMADRSSKRSGEYVLYSFRLINLRSSEVVWEDAVELKKQDPGVVARH